MSNILQRRQTHFVLWCPRPTAPPALVIGTLQNGNPPTLQPAQPPPIPMHKVAGLDGLWQLDPADCNLAAGGIYHYWFEVEGPVPGTRIQVTDPLAYGIDYRLLAPANPAVQFPAAVIQWAGGRLVACDPNGERPQPVQAPLEQLAANNRMVIYELPTAWVRTSQHNEYERAVGTFRDVQALVDEGVPAANFPDLRATTRKRHLLELGINALQLLPPADSIYARQWGYGTSHYLAPDYELGYPEGHLAPTANQDLTALVNACHEQGIRVILDVVMGFAKDEPYRHIDPDAFYLEHPEQHRDDPDAYSSRYDQDGKKELRGTFGGSCLRYIATTTTYDPVTGNQKEIAPARQHMLTFLTRWMQDFHIDGIRMDSVENVANWDFIQEFRNEAHRQFRQRYGLPEEAAVANFIVVGEELSLPMALLEQKRLDGLWNDRFRALIRPALIGQSENADASFEWTVRKAIDCRSLGFADGANAVNYLTSHDVQDPRRERLYNYFIHTLHKDNSRHLFNEDLIRYFVWLQNGQLREEEIRRRADEEIDRILHRERLKRIKLAFACLLTAVGIPMILAGEEFADQHDLFDRNGHVTQEGGKQVDPVNFSRAEEKERQELFAYVARLVHLRTAHPALGVNETDFIHTDFREGKRVLVWKRGTDNPVVVVANFSDYATPGAPAPGTEYIVPNWPPTPAGQHWYEATQQRHIATGLHNRESIFAWEAKVYHLTADE